MSSYMVLAAVSDALRSVLWDAFNADPVVRSIVGSEAAIVFTNPTETARDSSNRLSLWMYQVSENEFVKNQPAPRRNGHNSQLETPFALNLNYLITPFAPSGEADHLLLGLTLQTLYENAILVLQRPADAIFEELRLVFCRLTIEELTRIWEALREPYRLSVCYQVRVTHIDSLRTVEKARVLDSSTVYRPLKDVLEE
jgi:hypothetical protein